MGKIFGLDSPVVRFMARVGELMLFTVLWILCSLPVITAGAATTALFRMMFNIKEDRSTKITDFFRAFRDNFRKATALWLILLAAVAVLLGIYALAAAVGSNLVRLVLMLMFSAGFFVMFVSGIWLFPLTAYFENTVSGTLRNAVAMGLGHLRNSIPACALLMLPLIAQMVFYELFMSLLFLWTVLAPGAIAYGIVWILWPVFKKYIPAEQ